MSLQIRATLLGKQRQILNTFIWDWRGHKHPFEEPGHSRIRIRISWNRTANPEAVISMEILSNSIFPPHPRKEFSMQNPIVMQTHTFEQSAIEDWADWGIERRLQGKHLRMLKISCGGGPARQCPSIFALKGHFTAIGNSSCPFSAQQRK